MSTNEADIAAWKAFTGAVHHWAHVAEQDDLAEKRALVEAAKAYVRHGESRGAGRNEPQRAASADGGAVFPPYGKSKGMPIAGASMRDLEFYRAGCERTLADPAKERFWGKERALLAAIEAEIARQGGA